MRIVDAHIHLDMYEEVHQKIILENLTEQEVDYLISVSNNFKSSQKNLQLASQNHSVKPAFGFHPEQPLPSKAGLENLLLFMKENNRQMIAIGEVGLPYYLRQEDSTIRLKPYVQLLEIFIKMAASIRKPIILHAVYEDALIACDLLEKYQVEKAHFHWFKGDAAILNRIIDNDYVISVTLDVCYEMEIQEIVRQVPLDNLLVETDGPWAFAGEFNGQLTNPGMMHESMKKIAQIKETTLQETYEKIYANTCRFYELD